LALIGKVDDDDLLFGLKDLRYEIFGYGFVFEVHEFFIQNLCKL